MLQLFLFVMATLLIFGRVAVALPVELSDRLVDWHSREHSMSFAPVNDSAYIGVTFSGKYCDWYRTGGMEQANASFSRQFSSSAWMIYPKPVPWRLSAERFTSFTRLNPKLSGNPGSLRSIDDGTGMSLKVQPLSYLQVQSQFRSNHRDYDDLGFSLRGSVPRYGSAIIGWSRLTDRSAIALEWEGNPAAVDLHVLQEGMTAGLITSKRFGFQVAAEGRKANLIRSEENPTTPTYSPWGSLESYRLAMTHYDRSRSVTVGVRGWKMNAMAYGMQYDLTFSKLTYLDFQHHGAFGSYHYRTNCGSEVDFGAEYMHFEGYSRGHVEFYPFVSGWVWLLGSRRLYIADAAGYLWHYRFSAQKSLKLPRLRYGLAVDFYDVCLDGYYSDWRPAFLVFGVADFQSGRIALQRAQLGKLTFSISESFETGFSFRYEFQQLFPIHTTNRASPTGIATGPSKSTSATTRSYGGAIHTLTLSQTFELFPTEQPAEQKPMKSKMRMPYRKKK